VKRRHVADVRKKDSNSGKASKRNALVLRFAKDRARIGTRRERGPSFPDRKMTLHHGSQWLIRKKKKARRPTFSNQGHLRKGGGVPTERSRPHLALGRGKRWEVGTIFGRGTSVGESTSSSTRGGKKGEHCRFLGEGATRTETGKRKRKPATRRRRPSTRRKAA